MFTYCTCVVYIALMHGLRGAQWQMQYMGERVALMCSAAQHAMTQ